MISRGNWRWGAPAETAGDEGRAHLHLQMGAPSEEALPAPAALPVPNRSGLAQRRAYLKAKFEKLRSQF